MTKHPSLRHGGRGSSTGRYVAPWPVCDRCGDTLYTDHACPKEARAMPHTPGPWTHDKDHIVDAQGNAVAEITNPAFSLTTELANARLIAAAPELRALATDVSTMYDMTPIERAAYAYLMAQRARALLARIGG